MADWDEGEIVSMLTRLLLAAVLSSVIGWDRERRSHPAGLRTHILVCMGAALLTLVSESYGKGGGPLRPAEPDRITAQIVSGIGFLGAGTILVHGRQIKGLTTAASLWLTAAIGITVARGGEFYVISTVATLLVMFVLTVVDNIEDWLLGGRKRRELILIYPKGEGVEAEITKLFDSMEIEVVRTERLDASSSPHREAEYRINLPRHLGAKEVHHRLLELSGIRSVEWYGARET